MLEIGSKIWMKWRNGIYCSEISEIRWDGSTDIRVEIRLFPIIGNVTVVRYYKGLERGFCDWLWCYCTVRHTEDNSTQELMKVSFNVEKLIKDER